MAGGNGTAVAEPARAAGAPSTAPTPDADARSVLSYFLAFAPAPEWNDLVDWPPDVFALANLVLDHTEAYRFVVAPRGGTRWPPLPDWNQEVREAGRAWRDAVADGGGPPPLVRRCWDEVTRDRDVPLARVRSGEAWELTTALLTLHAVADEACSRVGPHGGQPSAPRFERLAWARLQEQGSLARLSPTRVRIVPKAHFASLGITIRSLSRHLALCYESVDVRWRSVAADRIVPATYTIVLVPWPLAVESGDFRSAPPNLIANMDLDRFGFFEFAPAQPLDHDRLDGLLAAAERAEGRIDAVVFPEGAVAHHELPDLERTLDRHGATFLFAGLRHPADPPAFGRNSLHFGVRTEAGWERYEQDKHHRWCLDAAQIRRYHLTRALDPGKLWWEAIDIVERTMHVLDVGGATITPMICEDLARLDEVADLVRRIGPTLVVALLLDGPQLATRWPCRYASVIADDPGSAVLTLTAYGMAARSRGPGMPPSRVVAHWNTGAEGVREIELGRGAGAVCLSTAVEQTTLWTADGRCHDDVPGLRLTGVRQLRA